MKDSFYINLAIRPLTIQFQEKPTLEKLSALE